MHHRSGLQGLVSVHDFRDLCTRIDAGDGDARAAYAVYRHRLRKYVGAYLAVLGGADAIVFTGGVGENLTRIREVTLVDLHELGISVDRDLNRAENSLPRTISSSGSQVAVLVVPTDEELAIARQVQTLLS